MTAITILGHEIKVHNFIGDLQDVAIDSIGSLK